jgi:hypothetical protein
MFSNYDPIHSRNSIRGFPVHLNSSGPTRTRPAPLFALCTGFLGLFNQTPRVCSRSVRDARGTINFDARRIVLVRALVLTVH